MSIIKKIFGAGGEAASKPIEAVGNIIDNVFTSKDEKLTHQEIRMRIAQEPGKIQAEINKIEAQHRSVFVAGWRPFIGWVCGISLAVFYIPQFAIASYLWANMCVSAGEILPYPEVHSESLFELVLGMLGMAVLRTAEKAINKTK